MPSYTSDSITLHLKVIFYFSHYKYIIVSVYFYNSTFLYTSSSTIVLYVVFIIVVFTLGSIATIVFISVNLYLKRQEKYISNEIYYNIKILNKYLIN